MIGRRSFLGAVVSLLLAPVLRAADRFRRIRRFVVTQAATDCLVFDATVKCLSLSQDMELVGRQYEMTVLSWEQLDETTWRVRYKFSPRPKLMYIVEGFDADDERCPHSGEKQ